MSDIPVISAEHDGAALFDLGDCWGLPFEFEAGRKPVRYADERDPGSPGGRVAITWRRVVYKSEQQVVTEEFAYTTEAERDAIDDELRRRGVPI